MESQSEIYKPLNSEAHEIRLLKVLTATDIDEPICCTLELFRLDDAPQYAALSYEWGEEEDMKTNNISINSHQIHLRSNLFNALLNIRTALGNEKRYVLLWVDAVCINQQDIAERGQQVKMMSKIYQKGYVLAWLGCEEEKTRLGFDLINKYRALDEEGMTMDQQKGWIKRTLFDPKFESHWASLTQIYRMSYWTRIWIIQEIVCGRNILLQCGQEYAPFYALSGITLELFSHFPQSRTRAILDWSDVVQEVITSITQVAVIARHRSWWRSTDQKYETQGLLFNLVLYKGSCCSDPRDRIYALLGVTLQYQGFMLDIDYSIPLDIVLINTAYCLVLGSQKLEVLLSCSRKPNALSTLPSWVPDWTDPMGRHVVPERSESRKFAASRSSLAMATFSGDRKILTTRALLLGTIHKRSLFYDTNITAEDLVEDVHRWTKFAVHYTFSHHRISWNRDSTGPEISHSDIIRALYETMFYPCPSSPEFLTTRSFEEFLSYALRVASQDSVDAEKLAKITRNLAMYLPVTGRCLFSTTVPDVVSIEKMTFGLCLPEAKIGDVVAILLGCSQPVVLRQHEDQYELIGQAYVHGFMHGETLGKLPEVDISLT